MFREFSPGGFRRAQIHLRRGMPSWLPLAIGLAGLSATVLLCRFLIAQERNQAQKTTALAAYDIKSRITSGVKARVLPLERIAMRWQIRGQPSQQEWESDANLFYEAYTGYESIEWIDPSYQVRWAVPLRSVNDSFAPSAAARTWLDAARRRKATTLSSPIDLTYGGRGALVAVPIYRGDSFEGYIVGIFRLAELFSTLLDNSLPSGYSVSVSFNRAELYASYTIGGHPANGGGEVPVAVYNARWTARVWPAPEALAASTKLIFVLGLTISSLLYLSGALGQLARGRTKIVEWANRELEKKFAERKDWVEALRQANGQLEAVIQASPLAILDLDLNGYVKGWNASAERMFGWSEPEVLDRFLPILGCDQMADCAEILASTSRGELLAGLELRACKKDGLPVEVSFWTAPLRDALGSVCRIIVAVADISERKKLEERLRDGQKMEAVGRLAGGIAHDFNNLLTVINGYSGLMLNSSRLSRRLRGQLEEVLKAGNRAAALTTQLLAFSRRQMIQPRALNLNHVVTNLERMLRRVIGEHIEFRTVLSPTLGHIRADRSQMEQILINLAANARDAMAHGGTLLIQTAEVEISGEQGRELTDLEPGVYVQLTISDTGNGMDVETKTHLFEPFFTTKEVGKGTGLGLSSVYGGIKQNLGAIVVHSELGRGTAFSIYLPRMADEAEPVVREKTFVGRLNGTETILLVEDEEAVRKMARETLETVGFSVLEAADGAQALRDWGARAQSIDLLLTDVVMPLLNGRELAARLTQMAPALKVLYMSGYTEDVVAYHGVLDSDTVLIQKPFAPEALLAKVRELLDSRGWLARTHASNNEQPLAAGRVA